MKKIFICLFWVVHFVVGIAQVHDSRLFTPQDGLIATEINNIGCDARGRIWTCSNISGVCVYDGRKFEKYTISTRPAIIDNHSTAACFSDSSIWLLSNHRGLTRIKGNIVKNYPIQNIPFNQGSLQKTYPRSGSNQVVIDDNQGHFWAFDAKKDSFKLIYDFKQRGLAIRDYHPAGIFLATYPHSTKNGHTLIKGDMDGKKEYIDWSLGGEGVSFHLTEHQDIIAVFDHKLWRYVNKQWRIFTPKTLSGTIYKEEIHYFFYSQNRFWAIQTLKDKRRRLLEFNDDLDIVGTCLFRCNSNINNAVKDLAGNYWIGTWGGLLRINPHILTFDEKQEPEMIASIHAIGEDKYGKIWFASYSEGLSVYDGKTLKKHPRSTNPDWRFLPSSLTLSDGTMVLSMESDNFGLCFFDGQNWSRWLKNQTATFLISQLKDGRLALGVADKQLGIQKKAGSIARDSTDWLWIDDRKGLHLTNVIGLTEDNFGRVWVGRPSKGMGVYDRKADTARTWLIQNTDTDFGVGSCITDSYGNLWFGTNKGLYLYKPTPQYPTNPFKEFTPISANFLGKVYISSLKIWQDKWLIVGTEKGFSLLNLEEFYAVDGKEGRFTVIPYQAGQNFSGGSTEQNAVIFDKKNDVWLGYEGGAACIELKNIKIDTLPFRISIDSVNDYYRTYLTHEGESLTLNSGEHGVQIYFSITSNLFLSNNFLLKYRLVDKTDWTILSSSESIILPLLAPNSYTLELVGIKNGIESPPQYLTFRIPKIWYQSEWFWLCFTLVCSGLGFAYYRQYQERQRIYTKLQVQAITNQLNPHFINNTLNLVQIKTSDNADAVEIVDLLSQNIHTVFYNTRNSRPYHCLSDELRIVENYLSIQQHRFKKDLIFELPTQEIVQKLGNILIPLMQILIHCENAVEHGIRNRMGQGKVTIKLKDEQYFIYIVVEDDGIGREKAHQIGSKGTQSGTKMLNDLANITNRQNRYKINSHYEDGIFTSAQGEQFGTRVHIRIPKTYKYEPD